MRKKRRRLTGQAAVLLALLMIFTMAPQSAFADSDSNGVDVEWANQTNSSINNCVTDRNLPIPELANLKWATKLGTGFVSSTTPPIILNGKLYTAAGNIFHEVDKETGESIRQVTLLGNIGFALNSPTYGEGKIFVPIGKGQIQALDANTLETLWVSEQLSSTSQYTDQTVSPITYHNGYIYTGTWTTETSEGTFLCLSASADDDVYDDNGVPRKKFTWKRTPSGGLTKQDGTVSTEGTVTTPSGFYWAGAYASDDYVVFGSDDGSAPDTYTETAILYSVNPSTGELISTVGGIKGDIRSSILYDDGNVYFSTKGGRMYKVKMNEDGTFGTSSYADTGGMMTATPQKYGDRIYVGVSGQSQFDADSGHFMAVIRDDEILTESSIISSVRIPGYPQASCVLGTNGVSETGDVYVYFTYNARPGGIYCVKDNINSTSPQAMTVFTPPANMQNYCISVLACDSEGTIYYKNDSGYLMAVENNDAYIEDITVTPDTGTANWDKDYTRGTTEYTIKAPSNATKADISLKLPQGVTAEINGATYSDKYICDLKDRKAELKVTVTKGDNSREYTLNIICKSKESALSDITVNTSNNPTSAILNLTKTFTSTAVNVRTEIYDGTWTFANVWPKTTNADSSVKVYPDQYVSNSSSYLNEDGSIVSYVWGSGSSSRTRYPVYFTAGKTFSKVRVEVTSEDGESITNYYVTVHRNSSMSGLGEPAIELNKTEATVYTGDEGNTVELTAKLLNHWADISWESDNPSIATVDSKGLVKGIKPGVTIIRADSGSASAECQITVKEAPVVSNPPTVPKPPVIQSIATSGVSLSKTKYTATGRQIKPAVTVILSGQTLRVGTDYTLSYGTNKLGAGKVTVTGKGTFQGTVAKTFTINPRSTSIRSIRAGRKSATVKWRRAKDSVTGYQIAYKQKGAKKYKVIKVKGQKKLSAIFKKLAANKRYQFKIRTYKTVAKKTYYSKYSSLKTCAKIRR